MIRILLVDDHVILRAGLKTIINGIDRYKIVGEARHGLQALDFLQTNEADIVLTDIRMPEMDGIECTRNIVDNHPNTQVIAVTMHSECEYISRMVNAGAAGYILKDASELIICEAIDSVYAGNNYYGYEIERAILEGAQEELEKNELFMTLSQREIDVLRLIIDEKSNSEIANELFISIRTVDAHRRNLLRKTGSRNTVGLTKYAMKYQLI